MRRAVHQLIAAQQLADAGLLNVMDALHLHEHAVFGFLRGLLDRFQFLHLDVRLHHAPGDIAAAPAEADALAAPLGVLIDVFERLAVQLRPFVIGNIQHLLNLLRRLHGRFSGNRDRRGRRGGFGGERRWQEQGHQQEGTQPAKQAFHQ